MKIKHMKFYTAISIYVVFALIFSLFNFRTAAIFGQEIIDPQKVVSEREKLEKELGELDFQIKRFEFVISGKQKETRTLERDIAILDAKIGKLKLEIKTREISINKLKKEIKQNEEIIDALLKKSEVEKILLAGFLRRLDEIDKISLVEALLAYRKLGELFREIDFSERIQLALQDSLKKIQDSNKKLEEELEILESKKTEETQLKITQEILTKELKNEEAKKKQILKITKGEEKKYQKFLKETKEEAATIRSRLFLLAGSAAIPFEKAIEYANSAYKATGIRPAFLLAVITEESNLGENLGSATWKTAMSHSRCEKQRIAFQQITNELGLNPDLMPVSAKAWYGYCGGAMGPAQFMPTTWLLYKDRIKTLNGGAAPNPWNPTDAFIAAALLLKDNGAVEGNTASERKAALKYLAGSNWNKKAYSFYGDDVMAIAKKYQDEIDILGKS